MGPDTDQRRLREALIAFMVRDHSDRLEPHGRPGR
jgi:hypothetical protein